MSLRRVALRDGTDMAGPSWLAGILAAVMILTAAYSASRLAISRLRRRATEPDTDALHAAMGAAMAGMLVPRLNVLPNGVWAAVFGIAAAWFGWHAVRTRGPVTAAGSPSRFRVPHLIECVTMLYMLLSVHGSRSTHGGKAMAGMGPSVGPAGSFPVLAVVLALFMLGYIVWTTDGLTSLARARTMRAGPGRNLDHPSPAAVLAVPSHAAGEAPGTPATTRTRGGDRADRLVLAPGFAACGKLAMSITMGYMLILML
jgi:hypothetical protein